MKKIDFQVVLDIKNGVSSVISQIKDQIKGLDSEIKKTNCTADRFTGIFDNLSFPNVNAMISVMQHYGQAVSQATDIGVQFGQSIADLSSITGITGDSLSKLEVQARRVGVESGLGAAKASEAYSILASQIDVATIGIDGLNALQEKTVLMSQAAGITLVESANSLAGTINQFSLSADQAGRVANVLAAGSKYGAASIQELSQSFKVVGASAAAMGLNVEQTSGALEVLSKANLKGSEAGTALRNIILKLNTELGIDLTKTSLSSALDSLSPKLTDATYLSKLFGTENVAAAQFMIKNAEAIGEMTAKVTDTNVAQEQAAIRTDTTANKIEKLRAQMDEYKISMANGLGDYAAYVAILSEYAPAGIMAMQALQGLGTAIMWIGKQQVICNIATAAGTAATTAFKSVQAALNVVMSTNPVGLIVVAITALAAGLVYAYNHCEGFRKVVDSAWSAIKKFGIAIYDSVLKHINIMISGFKIVGIVVKKLFEGDFKGAIDAAKNSTLDLIHSATGLNFGNEIGKTNDELKTTKNILDQTNESSTFLGKSLQDIIGVPARKETVEKDIESTDLSGTIEPKVVTPVGGNSEIARTGGLINDLKSSIGALEKEKPFATTITQIAEINIKLEKLGKELQFLENAKLDIKIEIPKVDKNYDILTNSFSNASSDTLSKQFEKDSKAINKTGDSMRKTDRASKESIHTHLTLADKIGMVGGAMSNLGSAVGGVAGEWINYGANIVNTIATQMIPAITNLVMAKKADAVSGAISGASALPPPWNIIQLGLSVASVLASFAAIPAFANGGIVYGDTLARVGEYSGAGSNPEVIAPLSRLKQLLGTTSGSETGRVEFVISGRNLKAVLDKNNNIITRTQV